MTYRKGSFTIERMPRAGDHIVCEVCGKRFPFAEMCVLWGVVIIHAVCDDCKGV